MDELAGIAKCKHSLSLAELELIAARRSQQQRGAVFAIYATTTAAWMRKLGNIEGLHPDAVLYRAYANGGPYIAPAEQSQDAEAA